MRDLAGKLLVAMHEATATPAELEVDAAGNCYQDAGSFVLSNRGWKLIHGRPTLRRPPYVEYGHAWAEKGEDVYDPSSGFKGPRFIYYSLGNIDYRDNLVYTEKMLRNFISLSGHWGPWEGVDAVPISPDRVKEWLANRRERRMPRGKKSKAPRQPFKDLEKLFQRDDS